MPPTKLLAAALLLVACGGRDTTPLATPDVVLRPAHLFPATGSPGRELAFAPGDSVLATSNADGTVRLWRTADDSLARAITVPGGATGVVFTPDGRRLVTGGYDGELHVWRVADGSLERAWPAHGGTVWTIEVSPDGQRIASGGEDHMVKLWRLANGALLDTLGGHTRNVWRVRFSPDGRWLASGSFDRTLRMWDARTRAPVRTMAGHREAVVGLGFSADGALLASGSDDETVRLWRAADGDSLRTLPVGNHVYSVAFSPDGRWLATGGRARGPLGTFWHQVAGNRWSGPARGLRVWRVADGALEQLVGGHDDDVWSVAFSHDGRWVATSSEDGTARLWEVVPRDGVATRH